MSLRQRGPAIGITAIGFAVLVLLVTFFQTLTAPDAAAQSVRPPEGAVINARPPEPEATNAPTQPGETRPQDAVPQPAPGMGGALSTLGLNSDATLWGEVRHGDNFTVSIPDKKAATLVQTGGMFWEHYRGASGPLREYSAMAIFAVLALLFVFYLMRGRIKIEHGFSGRLIERFKPVERFAHWMLAVSFILLAITGLNLFYGRDLMIPVYSVLTSPEDGRAIFAATAAAGKWVHNNVAWAFMVSLALVFVMWVIHNIPAPSDLVWLAKGGGLLSKHSHPPSRKFNAGQKIIFWAVILLGASVSLSGLSLLFPFEMPLFAKTFGILNDLGAASVLGAPLPVDLSPVEEMQYAGIWHTMVAIAMIVIILAHIYIGTLGMEGAFDAMGSGMVDRNWAKEHHSLWVEEEDAKARRKAGSAAGSAAGTPAE